ncbi:MAG TPA: hypothetical protein VFN91_04890 [Myxococcaceae bacterium]|nr:hypothetical protein [Myxococcaceae bacterium]
MKFVGAVLVLATMAAGCGQAVPSQGRQETLNTSRAALAAQPAGKRKSPSPSFRFEIFDAVPGAPATEATSINEEGTIVGNYNDVDFNLLGFIRRRGETETVTVPFPEAIGTDLRAINARGDILATWGEFTNRFFIHGARIDRRGSVTHFDVPGSLDTRLRGLNDRGDIVGFYDSSSFFSGIGFLYRDGRFTSFEVPSADPQQTFPRGINNPGDIVGYFNDAVTTHGFVLRGGAYATVDVPDAVYTLLTGINEQGIAVGFFGAEDGSEQGFLYDIRRGQATPFSCPGFFTEANDINNAGAIVGLCFDDPFNGPFHAFLAEPR